MPHFAIIGTGPAGYYTAEALLRNFGEAARIDMIDRLPTPYGLVRSGVAPDHQSLKAVAKRFDKVAVSDGVRFVGNLSVGKDVGISELTQLYDAVVLATGAPNDRLLGLPGSDLPGVIGSAAFVGWYNGHPDFADLDPPLRVTDAVVVGNGNVALDIARILAKTRDEFHGSDITGRALDALEASSVRRITVLGRRGPHQIAMTPKELGELGHLASAGPHVDPLDLPPVEEDAALEPGLRKSVTLLRAFAAASPDGAKSRTIAFDFFAKPIAIEGDGRPERIIVERTRLGPDGSAHGTGDTYAVPCGLVVSAIGYRTPPIPDVPFDEAGGRFANTAGRIAEQLWAVGWARRGPSGTIGTNRPDGYEVADAIAAALAQSSRTERTGGAGLDALLADRGVDAVGFDAWQRIELAEASRARAGSPREKFTTLAELHAAHRA